MILAVSDVVWQAIIAGLVTVAVAWINHRLGQIHKLVNSSMGNQLKLNAVATRRLAMLTNSPVDVDAADLANKMLKEHESKQAKVDGVKT